MYKHSKKKLADEFASYIADKKIPLTERWALFQKAPSSLKDHDSCVVEFKCEEKFSSFGYAGREAGKVFTRHMDRHETIDTMDLVDLIMDKELEALAANLPFTCREFAQALMEEILERNLGSFDFDW